MAILDDSARKKAELAGEIALLKQKLESEGDPAQRQSLQSRIEHLELVWKARWQSDDAWSGVGLPAVDSGNLMTTPLPDDLQHRSGLSRASLRHVGPRHSRSRPPPVSAAESEQSTARHAMLQGKLALKRARESSGTQAHGFFLDALREFASAGRVFKKYGMKPDMAGAHAFMGAAHKERADSLAADARDEELNRAIGHLHAATQLYSEADSPELWADAHFTFGEACLRISEPKPKNAAAAFQAALRVFKPETHHEFWSKSLANFGIAVVQAIDAGELPMSWTGQAVAACRTALEELDEQFPLFRAYTASSLGRALATEVGVESNQQTGSIDIPAHLEESLTSLDMALATFTEAEWPFEWAEIQVARAGALVYQGRLAPADAAAGLFGAAAEAGRAALRVIPTGDARWMNLQLILFQAHKSLASAPGCQDVAGELDRALACIDAALPLCGPELAALKAQLEQERAGLLEKRSGL